MGGGKGGKRVYCYRERGRVRWEGEGERERERVLTCCSHCVAGTGEVFSMSEEEVQTQAEHCNKKKKSAKTVEVYYMMYRVISISVVIYF